MSSMKDLKDAIKETLLKSGALPEIRAKIRAEIFHMLQEDSELAPSLSNDNLLINELIREYLIYNGYQFTESVLLAESGQHDLRIHRILLEKQLGIKSIKDAEHLPLLYGLIPCFSRGEKPLQDPLSSSEKKE